MRLLVLAIPIAGLALSAAQGPALTLSSSDPRLVDAFQWAVKQAHAYVFDGDPVGPWYEAALPGRQAFCMRDVSHQSMGAQALGLAAYNYNMLHRFAENISASKDWCSYWEINRDNKPAPVDYKSDEAFWYDLPANFDVLDACYRMYQWTGDKRYLTDPVFLNFYDRTVHDYVEKWDLSPGRIMQRQRPPPPPGPAGRFLAARGIPSYIEGGGQFVLGVDLLAAEYAGFMAYSEIQRLKGNAAGAEEFLGKALAVKTLVNQTWWDQTSSNASAGRFYSTLDRQHRLQGPDRLLIGDRAVLYYGVAETGPKSQSALNALLERIKTQQVSLPVEEESHYTEILYRYGMPDIAYAQIVDLSAPDRKRREYPEVSFSVIGAIVNGAVGVNVDDARAIGTLPGLSPGVDWVEIANLPVRANVLAIRVERNSGAVLTNISGPSLTWKAAFAGSHEKLLVNGKPSRAQSGSTREGQAISWVMVNVKSGAKARVEIAP